MPSLACLATENGQRHRVEGHGALLVRRAGVINPRTLAVSAALQRIRETAVTTAQYSALGRQRQVYRPVGSPR